MFDTFKNAWKVEELRKRLRQQRESLDYYEKAALNEARSAQASTLLKFRESEIDIAELTQSFNAAREIHKGYIEAVYAYNISVLELELYTE